MVRPAHGLKAQGSATFHAPPMLGEDTASVLEGVLGYDENRLCDLMDAGVIKLHSP